MATWGAISMCMAACNSYITLSIVRLILGAVEAGFAPGVLFLLSSWYRKNELATRFALYYTASAFSGALGGLLAGAITGNLNGKGGVAGWRYLFIVSRLKLSNQVRSRANSVLLLLDRRRCNYRVFRLSVLHAAGLSGHYQVVDRTRKVAVRC